MEEDYNESLRASLHRLLDALFEEWSTTFCLAWTALMLGSIMFTNLWGFGPMGQDGAVLMVGLWFIPCVTAHILKAMIDHRH